MNGLSVGGINVLVVDNEIRYEAGATVDGDGAPNCYALPSIAHALGLQPLDNIRNALHVITDDPENPLHGYAGVVTDPLGKAVIQPDGPFKGYCLSPTALVDKIYPVGDRRRYVDSRVIPYISIPPQLRILGVQEGDGALVADRDTGRSVQCLVGDIGPRKHLGEVSIACAYALGFNASPRNGGVNKGIIVRIFKGSAASPAWSFSRNATDIAILVDTFSSQV